MAVETQEGWSAAPGRGLDRQGIRPVRIVAAVARFLNQTLFTSLTRRIVTLNLVGLAVLVFGILYLNQFRAGLIEARIQALSTQGEIIAAAIAASATVETGDFTIDPERLLELETGESFDPFADRDATEFPINPERVAPVLSRLITPTGTRARIYGSDGALILDSRHIYTRGDILRYDLPNPDEVEETAFAALLRQVWTRIWRGNLPIYQELGPDSELGYPEVDLAIQGSSASVVRVTDRGELIVSVAVPVQRFRAVVGALLLSTRSGDIDDILRKERLGIFRVFLIASSVTIVLSILLAGTIAGPVRRLAATAERVRGSIKAREQIPDFTDRSDEIGHLSQALRDMTAALYKRLDAIESFAADVAHELKNPLTSLRSAVETLPLAREEADRVRLIAIIQHDIRRLDRLISDISDASRLDAELAREEAGPVDVADMARSVIHLFNEIRKDDEAPAQLMVEGDRPDDFSVTAHDLRIGQVLTNLLDNARSFSPPNGKVRVTVRRHRKAVEIVVDDDGPGIRPENLEQIFKRFYTDRPEFEAFGNNSGLGLSISRQIVEAHGGRVWAETRPFTHNDPRIGEHGRYGAGARFVVLLPVD